MEGKWEEVIMEMPKWWMVPFTRWRTANPCKLRTIYLQRLLYTVVWIFFCNFIPLHLLWSFFKKQKAKNTTALHNHSHPEAAIFKTSLCSFWKVLVQRQKSENRQFSSFFFFQDARVTSLPADKSFDPYYWRVASMQTQELLKTFLWWDSGQQHHRGSRV